ncbi:type II toxin-antitoxin system RelE/ParE family toxin [Photorhabdus akhurstii]|uniref:type II toxin-antitoxin system RelE/ParE family toxin n=1 Tax=Photorhabdus akhurstii TaxID=171438 RepID=UPI001C2ED25C|nr:type II toxin-antitoxin system RelE/ParE family toxin [Photorhabdus akhurstii]
MSVRFTKKAREHIRAIKLYSMRRWGANVAEAYSTSLRVTMTEILARHPSPGRDRSEDLYFGVLSFPGLSELSERRFPQKPESRLEVRKSCFAERGKFKKIPRSSSGDLYRKDNRSRGLFC